MNVCGVAAKAMANFLSLCEYLFLMLRALYLMHAGVRKTWYIQEQQLVQYQQLDDLYCVAATYSLENATVPFFSGTVVTVYNYANVGSVNGPNQNKNNMTLCARAVNAQDSSRLAVAPCFLPNILAGPYWVLGIGKAKDGTYDWAVVIGGEPSVKWDDGCTTKEEGTNGNCSTYAMYSDLRPLTLPATRS